MRPPEITKILAILAVIACARCQSIYFENFATNRDCATDGVPGPVQNLQQTDSTENSITIDWDPPEDTSCVHSYVITIPNIVSLTSSDTETEILDLTPCTNYTVIVTGRNSDRVEGEQSSAKVSSAPPTPANVQITGVAETKATIQWELPQHASCVSEYQVLDESDNVLYTTTDTFTYTVSTLQPCNTYKYSVVTIAGTARSQKVPAVINTVVPKITNLNQNEATTNTASITWDPSTCDVQEYQVSSSGNIIKTTQEPLATLDALNPCTSMDIEVLILTKANISSEATPLTIKTVSDVVETLEVTSISETEASISWIPPSSESSCINSYRVYLNEEVAADTTETNHVLTTLSGCTTYDVQVVTVTDIFESAPVGENFQTKPGMVSNLAVSNVIDEEATATWTPPQPDTCIVNYKIMFDGKEATSTEPSYLITNLSGCGKYNLTVVAVSVNQDESAPADTSFETLPGQITNLQVYNIRQSEALISWSGPLAGNCIKGYKIVNTVDGTEIASTENTEILLQGLTACQLYDISVIAFAEGFESLPTSVQFTTAPGIVLNLQQSSADLTEVMVSWEAPEFPSCIKSYEIELDGTHIASVPVGTLVFRVEDLVPCTDYTVIITALSNEGHYGDSKDLITSTDVVPALGFVKNLHQSGDDLNSVTIEWEAPDYPSCVSSYNIYFQGMLQESVENTELAYTFHSLDMCTEGNVGVAGVLPTGAIGPQYEITVATTIVPECALPGPVRNLMQDNDKTTEIEIAIEWDAPRDPSKVHNYSVILDDDKSTEKFVDVTQEWFTFTNLLPCSKHRTNVTPVTIEGNYSTANSIWPVTRPPKSLLPIEQLKLNRTGLDELYATWKPPASHVSCVTDYEIVIWSDKFIDLPTVNEMINGDILFYTLSPLAGCRDYVIGVKAKHNRTLESPIVSASHDVGTKVMNPPECSKTAQTSTSATFSCKIQSYEQNLCIVNSLTMTCDSTNGPVSQKVTIPDNNRQNVRVVINGLIGGNTYKCTAILDNEAGKSEPSQAVDVTVTAFDISLRQKRTAVPASSIDEKDEICISEIATEIIKLDQLPEQTSTNEISIAWIPEDPACVQLYTIYHNNINEIELPATVRKYTAKNTTDCEELHITVEPKYTVTKSTKNITVYSKSAQLPAETIHADKLLTKITWDKPPCEYINGYIVKFFEEAVTEVPSDILEYPVQTSNLELCQPYNFMITPFTYINTHDTTVQTKLLSDTTTKPLFKVPSLGEINLKQESGTRNSAVLTWTTENAGCISQLKFEYNDSSSAPQSVTVDAVDLTTEIQNINSCKGELSVTVSAILEDLQVHELGVHNVRTVSDGAPDITIIIKENVAHVSWQPADESCFTEYLVIKDTDPETVLEPNLATNIDVDLNACELFKMQVFTVNEGVKHKIPIESEQIQAAGDKVLNIKQEDKGDGSVFIKWDLPKVECDIGYIISTDDFFTSEHVTTTEAALKFTVYCQNVNVKVASGKDLDLYGAVTEKVVKLPSPPVDEASIVKQGNKIIWAAPDCPEIIHYNVIFNQKPPLATIDDNPIIDIPSDTICTQFSVTIIPLVQTNDGTFISSENISKGIELNIVKGLKQVEGNNTHIQWTRDLECPPDSYQIHYNGKIDTATNEDFLFENVVTCSEFPVNIIGVLPGGHETPPSNDFIVKTHPTPIDVSLMTFGHTLIRWQNPCKGVYLDYRVKIDDDFEMPITGNVYPFTDKQCQKFTVQIKSVRAVEDIKLTSEVSEKIFTQSFTPIHNLQITNIIGPSATLTWEKLSTNNCDIKEYKIYLNNKLLKPSILDGQELKYPLENLNYCTDHSVYIETIATEGGENTTNPVPFKSGLAAVENISYKFVDLKTTISWDEPTVNLNCNFDTIKYHVEDVSDGSILHDDISNTFDYSAKDYCQVTNLKFTTTTDTILQSEPLVIQFTSNPNVVENFTQISSTSNSVTMQWSPPANQDCLTRYEIIYDEHPISVPKEDVQQKITVAECSSGEISIKALSEHGESKATMAELSSTAHIDVPKVTNPKQTAATVNSATVEWEASTVECLKGYKVRGTTFPEFSATENVTEIGNLNECDNTVEVAIELLDGKMGEFEILQSVEIVGAPATEIETTPGMTSLDLNWKFTDLKCINSFTITSDDQDVPDLPTDLNTYTLTDLKGCTTYNIGIVGVNKNFASTPTTTTGTTENSGDLPKPDITIENTFETGFDLSWQLPQTAGCNYSIKYYEVRVIGLPTYPHPSDPACSDYTYNYQWNVSNKEPTSIQLTGIPSNYLYTVNVTAYDGITNNVATKNVTTLQDNPEPPRDLSDPVLEQPAPDNTLGAKLQWKYPCKANGKIKEFVVTTVGTSKETGENDPIGDITIPAANPDDFYNCYIPLKTFHTYESTVNVILEDESFKNSEGKKFETGEGFPDSPQNLNFVGGFDPDFTLTWNKPILIHGTLSNYSLSLQGKPDYTPDATCNIADDIHEVSPIASAENYIYNATQPNFKYTAVLAAWSQVNKGQETTKEATIVTIGKPSEVRNLQHFYQPDQTSDVYDVKATVSFDHPCTGPATYTMSVDQGQNPIENAQSITFDMAPNVHYEVIITATSGRHSTEVKYPIDAPGGVPDPPVPNVVQENVLIKASSPTAAEITFPNNLFNNDKGEILYYGLIIGKVTGNDYGYWDESNWPPAQPGRKSETEVRFKRAIEKNARASAKPYYITPKNWNPFIDASTNGKFIIGAQTDCTAETDHCNAPLTPGTTYLLKVRGLTELGYRDAEEISFITLPLTPEVLNDEVDLGMILGIVFGILAAGLLVGFMFFIWRRKQRNNSKAPQYHDEFALLPMPIPIKQFPFHYLDIKDNYQKLRTEFNLIESKSSEEVKPAYTAMLPKNKKKNRYVNILPYDNTRIVLEDKDEEYSDYINASYIKGISGAREYIASQGPLPNTCLDFWKMIMQENVHIIVMVAQFVEQNKEKCFKYFPRNHENIEVGDDIEIRCMNELDFGWYCIRTIQLQQNMRRQTLTHLQFLDWPDFGCPTGTKNMLEFVRLMRQHIHRGANRPTVVHCSAGVGRTGTIIALDILLQSIKYSRDIDIFGTVMQLRQQRPRMVQTEKQYMYLHDCIYDYLQNPHTPSDTSTIGDPIYANVGKYNRF